MSHACLKNTCLEIVRRHDPDKFLIGLMMPARHRAALWALFAFNYEIAKTREVVSDTTIGLIRLQWWRDAIAEIYEGTTPRHHEVVEPLAAVIKAYDLPREDFDHLIYAREFDLEGVSPPNLKGFINYCDFTTTPLFRLALKICGEEEGAEVLSRISINFAVIGIIRAVSYMRKQRRLMLPLDIMKKYNVLEQKFFDFNEVEALPKVIEEIIGRQNILRYDKTIKHQPSQSRFLKKMDKVTWLYARQIESVEYNVYDPRLNTPPPFLALRLWLSA